uniref:Uncharacterized protein n=1 Tax=Timema genevievae TaxID=629358 RepID=A0A7R9K2Z9_TIMGE|nr:unnamed protein product [Timema genevievae]
MSGGLDQAATEVPRIDPLQLLKCLSVLLSPEGGIKSKDEVQRLASSWTGVGGTTQNVDSLSNFGKSFSSNRQETG